MLAVPWTNKRRNGELKDRKRPNHRLTHELESRHYLVYIFLCRFLLLFSLSRPHPLPPPSPPIYSLPVLLASLRVTLFFLTFAVSLSCSVLHWTNLTMFRKQKKELNSCWRLYLWGYWRCWQAGHNQQAPSCCQCRYLTIQIVSRTRIIKQSFIFLLQSRLLRKSSERDQRTCGISALRAILDKVPQILNKIPLPTSPRIQDFDGGEVCSGHTHARSLARALSLSHTRTCTRRRTNEDTRTQQNTLEHNRTHTHTNTQTYTHTQTHNTNTHKHLHTYTNIHIHTYTPTWHTTTSQLYTHTNLLASIHAQVQSSLDRFVKSAPEGLKRTAQMLGDQVLPIAKVYSIRTQLLHPSIQTFICAYRHIHAQPIYSFRTEMPMSLLQTRFVCVWVCVCVSVCAFMSMCAWAWACAESPYICDESGCGVTHTKYITHTLWYIHIYIYIYAYVHIHTFIYL